MNKNDRSVSVDDLFHTGTIPEAVAMGKRGDRVTTSALHDFLASTFQRDEALRVRARFELGKVEKSQNEKGNRAWYIWLVIIGVVGFLVSLGVDYTILNDFWSHQLMNEFGAVPEALRGGVIAKSIQALFVVAALHQFLGAVGHIGRRVYMAVLGVLAICLIVGIGGIYAVGQMPEDTQLFGIQFERFQSTDPNAELCAIGLGENCDVVESEPQDLDGVDGPDLSWLVPLLWLLAVSLIFIVVSSVGAFSLHAALDGINGLLKRFNSADWSGGSERKLAVAADRAIELREILAILDDPAARSNRYGNLLAQFVSDYRAQDKAVSQGLSETAAEIRKHWSSGHVRGMMTGSVRENE